MNVPDKTRTEIKDDRQIVSACQEAIAALERAQEAPPVQVSQEGDVAERAVVRARNILILRLRQQDDSNRGAMWRGELDRLNGILSLAVGIEYPMAGIQRELIRQACDALKGLLGEIESHADS